MNPKCHSCNRTMQKVAKMRGRHAKYDDPAAAPPGFRVVLYWCAGCDSYLKTLQKVNEVP